MSASVCLVSLANMVWPSVLLLANCLDLYKCFTGRSLTNSCILSSSLSIQTSSTSVHSNNCMILRLNKNSPSSMVRFLFGIRSLVPLAGTKTAVLFFIHGYLLVLHSNKFFQFKSFGIKTLHVIRIIGVPDSALTPHNIVI